MFVVDNHVNMIQVVLWMLNYPGSGRDSPPKLVAIARGRLLSSGSIRKPDTTFAGWRVVPLGDVQPIIAMALKIGVISAALAVLLLWPVPFP
jgi:hypothetical protein